MAAAALAAGVISTQAQVYSQNVVGYYNLNLVAGYNMVSVQFNVGASNGASEVFPNIPDSTELFTFDAIHGMFIYNYFDTGGGSTTPANSWYMSDYNTLTNAPILSPGTGCFLLVPNAVTNAVVGSVVSSNNLAMVSGYNMLGSALPLGVGTTNSLVNLNTLPDSTELFTFDTAHQKYIFNYYDTGGGSTPPNTSWYMSDYNTPTNPPVLSVGQGMFFLTPSTYNWTQTFTNN